MFKNKIKVMIACLIITLGLLSLSSVTSAASGCSTQEIKNGTCNTGQIKTQLSNNPIDVRLNDIVTFLSAAVGILIVANVIIGGVQYSTAGGSPQKVSEARKRIGNGFLALFAFLLLYAFVQWLIPGGVFG